MPKSFAGPIRDKKINHEDTKHTKTKTLLRLFVKSFVSFAPSWLIFLVSNSTIFGASSNSGYHEDSQGDRKDMSVTRRL